MTCEAQSGLLQSWSVHLNSSVCLLSLHLLHRLSERPRQHSPGLGSAQACSQLTAAAGLAGAGCALMALFLFLPRAAVPVLPAVLAGRGQRGQLRAHAPQHLSLRARLRLLPRRLHPHEPRLSHLHLPCRQH